MNVLRKVSREATRKRWQSASSRNTTTTACNYTSNTSSWTSSSSGSSCSCINSSIARRSSFLRSSSLIRSISTDEMIASTYASSSTTSTTSPATPDISIIQDGKKRVLESCLQGDAIKAQEILDQLEEILKSNKSETDETLLECHDAILDAWMSHQSKLFEEYNNAVHATPTPPTPSTSVSLSSSNQKKLEVQIFHAADKAHQALEHIVPFLSRPARAIYAPKTVSVASMKAEDVAVLEDIPGGLGSSISAVTKRRRQLSSDHMLHQCNSVLLAWARASQVSTTRQGIPQRATFVLQRLQVAAGDNSSRNNVGVVVGLQPTTESYNRVLEAWAWSREHLRATMAEHIFQNWLGQSKKQSSKNKTIAKPDGESYRWIIQAWCHSQQRKSAFTATGHLMKYLRRLEKSREERDPNLLETYHRVMKAWTTAEDKNTPVKAMGMLRIMEYAESKRHCGVIIDETCYRYFLQASAKAAVLPEQGPLADQILNKLKQRQIVPDGDCYGAAIRIWKNAALNPLYGMTREHNVTRTVELLEELSTAHQRSALAMIRPTTEHFNDVLEALSASDRAVSRDIAATLVDVMESAINEDSDSALVDIRPNIDTYKWFMLVHSKSKRPDKIESAKQVLERVKANLTTVAEDNARLEDSLVGVHNAFVQVCASYQAGSDERNSRMTGEEVLQNALRAVEDLRTVYGLSPNSETYANLLGVCKTQLEVGSKRSRIMEDIFQSCCAEALVDESVLQALKSTTSGEQYYELVVSKSDIVEGTRMVPEDWTCNVGVNRIITADGRRAKPLSVDGRYTITKAMKEYKMRKLRSKANQRVLQGGRLKLDKKRIGKPIKIHLDKDKVVA